MSKHPSEVLFSGEKSLPAIPACEHFVGSEKLIRKALDLQEKLGGCFDITADCEDGARAGHEEAHMRMVAGIIASRDNARNMIGVRIHDPEHPHWKADVDLLIPEAGDRVAYITIPKPTRAAQAAEVIEYIQGVCAQHGVSREIPVHVLIETQGAVKHDASQVLINAQDAEWGPIQYQGELHDRATYRDCWNLLQQARVFGKELDVEATQRFF